MPVRRFQFSPSTLSLERGTTTGTFFDVVGRRAAAFGYEGRSLEVWVYPLKILDDFRLRFQIEGYPLPMAASDLPSTIQVAPEATTFTFSHAAFTARVVMYAPIDEPAVVLLLDIDTTLPMTVLGSFRPMLRPMWPAGAQTPNVGWDGSLAAYEMTEETGRLVGIVGVPGGRDRSLMPYQEEPRDVPLEFAVDVTRESARQRLIPIVVTGSIEGRTEARTAYTRVLGAVEKSFRQTASHYTDLLQRTLAVDTPDARLDTAFAWARVGIDKGLATNPTLGTGLLAGFRTSGNSERPGFAWFFGRDALWTSLALISTGALDNVRTALTFLERFQWDDGKIPHEISQSAMLVPWFTDYPYPWASADANVLYVIAHAELWRATGDRMVLGRHWPSIVKAYAFSAATDRDANGLIDNTGVGHGWVEGGALHPPHEEIYLQGLWIEASRGMGELATAMGDGAAADAARRAAERTRSALESTYWLPGQSHYAFATRQPRSGRTVAEPGPERERRQRRLDELAAARLVDEDTVLPAVPLWWGLVEPERADAQIDRLGSAALATDWGHRILSNRSLLYDPLSYHYGSVWPLFTGWASMAAYRYGRPHVGHQALLANALLTESGTLGYITELLSGDVNAPFGRSSHHQVWSEAMVVTPLVRGLLGIEPSDGGRRLRIAPQLPADWDRVAVQRVTAGGARMNVEAVRSAGGLAVRVTRTSAEDAAPALLLAPALPLDARVEAVTVDGKPVRPNIVRTGDVQFVEVAVPQPSADMRADFKVRGGSDVYVARSAPRAGARNEGIRILRSRADARALRLLVEGRNGRTYDLFLRTPRRPGAVQGGTLIRAQGRDPIVRISFEGADEGDYSRRDVVIALQ
jgi:glycogen debranching enzyme